MGVLNRFLLDTHALLWLDSEPAKLPARVVGAIEESTAVFVGAASAYEIALKNRTGKLPDVEPLIDGFAKRLEAYRFHHLEVSIAHAVVAGRLDLRHKDPFDRLLIAQALVEDMVLVSNEKLFDEFGVKRLW